MKVSEKTLANLKPWKPGQSGNPSGRPKRDPITQAYKDLCNLPLPEKIRKTLNLEKGATFYQAIAVSQIFAAVKGSVKHAKEIADRVEGKAIQKIEIAGEGGSGLSLKVEFVEPGSSGGAGSSGNAS